METWAKLGSGGWEKNMDNILVPRASASFGNVILKKSVALEKRIHGKMTTKDIGTTLIYRNQTLCGYQRPSWGVKPRATHGHGRESVEKPCPRAWGICISGQTPPGSYPRDLQMV